MIKIKTIGLIAHDACKSDMTEWVYSNAERLSRHKLICTGTTGSLISSMYSRDFPDFKVDITRLNPGPLGGDQQMGSLIATGKLDILIFFTDPMSIQPHDVDVKALERISTIKNIVLASTRSTADFIISSALFDSNYQGVCTDYTGYINRILEH